MTLKKSHPRVLGNRTHLWSITGDYQSGKKAARSKVSGGGFPAPGGCDAKTRIKRWKRLDDAACLGKLLMIEVITSFYAA